MSRVSTLQQNLAMFRLLLVAACAAAVSALGTSVVCTDQSDCSGRLIQCANDSPCSIDCEVRSCARGRGGTRGSGIPDLARCAHPRTARARRARRSARRRALCARRIRRARSRATRTSRCARVGNPPNKHRVIVLTLRSVSHRARRARARPQCQDATMYLAKNKMTTLTCTGTESCQVRASFFSQGSLPGMLN